jgi:hypothetical protein
VDRLSDLIEQLDRRPQQIILEIASFPGLPVDLDGAEVVDLAVPDTGALSGAYVPVKAYLLGTRDVKSVKRPDLAWHDSLRVATMSLLPVVSTSAVGPQGAMLERELLLMPRVSDSGAVAVSVRLIETGAAEDHDEAARPALIKSAPAATVTVGDGETFGLVFARGDDKVTVIARPQLLK